MEPNTTYSFRVWATNELGPGEPAQANGKTLHNLEESGKYIQQFLLEFLVRDFALGIYLEIFDYRINSEFSFGSILRGRD